MTDTPEWFRRQVRSAREGVNHRWVLLGSGLGADRIARGYYEFFGVVPPEAVILLAPSVSALYLNQITCPMLVLHSEEAWLSDFRMRSRMLDAIRHHQARYGDRSEHRVLESVPIGLEDEVLDPRIEDVITDWLVAELSDRRRVRPRAA